MQRSTTWKIAILSAALGGLSIAGAGTALADTGPVEVAPLSITAPIPTDWPYDRDDLDDAIHSGWNGHIVAFDDDWDDDDWGDDDWDDWYDD